MKRNLQYRLMLILVVLLGSIVLFYPPSQKIKLGLDLKGGIHLVLQVVTSDALEAKVDQLRERIAADLSENDIVFTRTGVTEDFKIEVLGVLQDQQAQLEENLSLHSLDWTYQIQFREGEIDAVLTMTEAAKVRTADETVQQARETLQRRVDQYGVAEPTITVYGSGQLKDQIIVELPGVEDFDRVLNLIRTTARLELKLAHPSQAGPYATREVALQAFDNSLPADYEILPYRNPTETGEQTLYMVVRKAQSIGGEHLKDARRSQDSFTGRAEIVFFLKAEGVQLFSRATEQNVGNRLAIVLDDEIRSAPNINERIASDEARITGSFTPEQAEDLALVLRSGALPAAIRILENRIIGPSLGLDSIRRGIQASLVGLALVVVGMLVVYRLSGINAIVCLVMNLLILLGVLSYFHATLTLPGIAGVILTIGMAVDANILIFERIKEEIGLGKAVRSAVAAGFDRVFSTIIDTNTTTLVAALFLFQFGTGPVRGFAVTLAVGLIANIFTAVFVSRTLFRLILERREVKRLSI